VRYLRLARLRPILIEVARPAKYRVILLGNSVRLFLLAMLVFALLACGFGRLTPTYEKRKRDFAMSSSRRVPYEPDPTAEPYHAAHGYAVLKGSKDPARFAWWYVDNCIGKMTVQEAWKIAPEDMKAL
jgi:hypothetical protein